jgi:phosphatidylglycerophosphate synthase
VARLLLPTGVSPNAVTLLSIVFGIACGVAMLSSFEWHLQLAGVCLFVSAVLDCADGQLARLRGTSSAFGRMLDGVADLMVSIAAVGGSTYVIWSKHHQSMAIGLMAIVLCVATAVTGSFHTGMYDHFKNVFLRLTSERFREGESYAGALARFEAKKERGGFWGRLAWPIYLFYVRSQEKYVLGFDPYTATRVELLPPYDAVHARIYRSHVSALMRVWRTWFGFGSLVFGIAIATFFNVIDWYMLYRLIALNAVFYGYMRPQQRRASRQAFLRMGVDVSHARGAV